MRIYYTLGAALLALVAGIVSAWYWWRASEDFESLMQTFAEERNALERMTKSNSLRDNRRAALWTAASVIASAISGILGAWPSN
jgi:hypothetical protein